MIRTLILLAGMLVAFGVGLLYIFRPTPPEDPWGHGLYDITPNEMYARLMRSDLEDLVDALGCGFDIKVRKEGVPGQSVTWRITHAGRTYARTTARITNLGPDRTRVDIETQDEENLRNDDLPYFVLNSPLHQSFARQVDAAIMMNDYDDPRDEAEPYFEDGVEGIRSVDGDARCEMERQRLGHPVASAHGGQRGTDDAEPDVDIRNGFDTDP